MSRSLLAVLLILPATASAQSGGTLAGPTASSFTVAPATVAPGARVTFALRATPRRAGAGRRDRARQGRRARQARPRRRERAARGDWRAAVAAGKYTARLVVTGAGVTRYYRAPLNVVAADAHPHAAPVRRRPRRHHDRLEDLPRPGPVQLRRPRRPLRRRPPRPHPPGPGHHRRRGHAGRHADRRHRALDRLPGGRRGLLRRDRRRRRPPLRLHAPAGRARPR